MRVGLVSDTHGLLRSEVAAFLQGSDHIVHAGDIGSPEILEALSSLAPLTAVLGNNDKGSWARHLRETELVRFGDIGLYVLHDLNTLAIDPRSAGIHVVVSGHSHKPLVRRQDGVLYVNPGSAGPRRFRLPISAAELILDQGSMTANIQEFL